MYNLASKVLGAMLDPFLLALLLALGSLFLWKKRRLAFRLLAASVLTTLALSMPWASGWLTLSLERQFPEMNSLQLRRPRQWLYSGGRFTCPRGSTMRAA